MICYSFWHDPRTWQTQWHTDIASRHRTCLCIASRGKNRFGMMKLPVLTSCRYIRQVACRAWGMIDTSMQVLLTVEETVNRSYIDHTIIAWTFAMMLHFSYNGVHATEVGHSMWRLGNDAKHNAFSSVDYWCLWRQCESVLS